MVVATMAWRHKAVPEANTLGILAFDAGKTMCRLISLYHSVSDEEITKLRTEVIKSKGVTYLNSQHECFLLNLAAAERLEELDVAAHTVSQLGRKCSDPALAGFDLVYADLKLGLIDLRKMSYNCRNTPKIVSKLEKLVSSTRSLHAAMESMAELEASEKKRQRWKTAGAANNYNNYPKQNLEYLNEQIAYHGKQVQHYKEVSLWNQTLDKTVGIMAKVVCIVYARICSVFGAYVTNCNCYNGDNDSNSNNCCCLLEHRELYKKNCFLYEEPLHKRVTKSGPIPKANNKTGVIRFLNHDREVGRPMSNVSNRVLRLAPPSTVGGAGLAARYAEVVLFAERCLHGPATVGEDAREALYEMLPERMRRKVGAKLKGRWRREEEGEALAEGWRDAVEELLEWLSPVAHDTVRWQAERLMEKARFETKTTALLLQTLHYSDLEKAEAAIVEVLVGLSCIYWCEKR
ncbi:phosphatidylinositol-3-phosphatase myotubularin-2 [Spatholobus suberectus]|nr:phosphatidylinositol-3-phosphatase myotubularin-2 [Spatholobus suberectus]